MENRHYAEPPEVGETVPKVIGKMIELLENGERLLFLQIDFPKSGLKALPDHDLVRYGFRLYAIHEYHAIMDAWRVTEFSATLSDAALEELSSGGD